MAGFTAAQVEEVHAVVRMIPIFWTTVLYWTIYAQVQPCLHQPRHELVHVQHPAKFPELQSSNAAAGSACGGCIDLF